MYKIGGRIVTARPKLPFHLKLRVHSKRPATREIDGRLGYVSGITDAPGEDGRFEYGILIYDFGRGWVCSEDECESIGELDVEAVKRSEEQGRRLADAGRDVGLVDHE
jgi:hypothetical protein